MYISDLHIGPRITWVWLDVCSLLAGYGICLWWCGLIGYCSSPLRNQWYTARDSFIQHVNPIVSTFVHDTIVILPHDPSLNGGGHCRDTHLVQGRDILG